MIGLRSLRTVLLVKLAAPVYLIALCDTRRRIFQNLSGLLHCFHPDPLAVSQPVPGGLSPGVYGEVRTALLRSDRGGLGVLRDLLVRLRAVRGSERMGGPGSERRRQLFLVVH